MNEPQKPLLADFPWGRFAQFQGLSPSRIAGYGEKSLQWCEAQGVKVPAGSRFPAYVDRLRWLAGQKREPGIEKTREGAEVLEAAACLFEMYIGTHAPIGDVTKEWREKVEQALGGAVLAEDETDHFARNIAAEVYYHGILWAGGLPATFREPDVGFKYEGEDLGLAVKRIWGIDGLRGRLSDAATQIESTGARGVIAIKTDRYLQGLDQSGTVEVKGKAYTTATGRIHGHLPYLAEKPHVLGTWGSGMVVDWQLEKDGLAKVGASLFNQLVLFGASDAEEARMNKFFGEDFLRTGGEWFQKNY